MESSASGGGVAVQAWVPPLQMWRVITSSQGAFTMLHFPLILLGYAIVPFIAIQLMIRTERSGMSPDQASFPQVEIL